MNSHWLCNTMSTDLLRDLVTNTMHGPTILTLKTSICDAYISIHPQRMKASSPLSTLDLLDICTFYKLLSL